MDKIRIKQNHENYERVQKAFKEFVHALVWESMVIDDGVHEDEVNEHIAKYCRTNGDMANVKDLKVDDKEFVKIEAIICSMTKQERRTPKILNASRRVRIAKGSGTSVQQINQFMKSFEMTQKMMKKMQDGKGMKNLMKNMNPQDLKNLMK